MSSANHLGEVYNTLSKRFLDSKVVDIQPAHGDPPEQYTVTFHLPGKKSDEQGGVSEAGEHKIEISLPFGFPKFPPKCKPLTPIFHPDFATGSVAVDRYWEKNSNLPDLIVHLAEMINCQHYSTDGDAYNPRAAEWYKEHAAEFPLAIIDWARGSLLGEGDDGDSEIQLDDELELTLEDDGELGIAADLSFDVDDEQLGLELEAADEDDGKVFFPFSNAEEEREHAERVRYYTAVKDRREFMRLKRELEGQIEFREMYAETMRILQNADRYYAKAKSCEKQGQNDKALELYQKTYEEVADYPAIRTDITRLEELTGGSEEKEEDKEKVGKKRDLRSIRVQTKGMGAVAGAGGSSVDSKPLPPPPPPRRRGFNRKLLFPLAALAVLVIGVLVIGSFFRDRGNMAEAERMLKQCGSSLEVASYKEAERFCQQGRAAAKKAVLFGGGRKGEIIGEFDTLLSSEEMQNGLAGRVVIDGRLYSAAQAKLVLQLKKRLEQAKEAYEDKRYGEAAKYFGSVRTLSQKVNYLDEKAKADVSSKYDYSMVKQDMLLIESRREAKKWQGMLAAVEDAQKRVPRLPSADCEALRVELAGCKVEANLGLIGQKMEKQINDGNWEEPAEEYKKAGTLAQNYMRDGKSGTIIYKEQLREIKQILLRASLYKEIDEANSAFASGHWDEAIASYGKSIELINDPEYALLDTEQTRKNNELLKKLILKASITKSEESV